MGLNEQMRDVKAFDFLAVVENAGIGDALQRLAGQTEAQAHEDLLWWTLQVRGAIPARAIPGSALVSDTKSCVMR